MVPGSPRNVPGVALYFVSLSQLRNYFARIPALSYDSGPVRPSSRTKLNPTGDLIAGSSARTSVGFILMPATVLKARWEVSLSHSDYGTLI